MRDNTVAVIVPTLNERNNVSKVIEIVSRSLNSWDWELIFVDDDSDDGTADLIRQHGASDHRIRCLQRIGRRGLASACIEGILSSTAPVVAIMDADLQHDVELLPAMVRRLHQDKLDIVSGSRYVENCADASAGEGLTPLRERLSRAANWLSQRFLRIHLTDPMSGFFVVRRGFFEQHAHRLSGRGYKLLLDLILAADSKVRMAEMPYTMRPRLEGETKLDELIALEYFMLLADQLFGRVIPTRFILFVLVGLSGMVVHVAVLAGMHLAGNLAFGMAQSIATLAAMTSNFFLNNQLTYRDTRIRGSGLIWGLLSFYLACSLGAIINVMLATYLFSASIPWLLAGLLGAGVASVWNYAVSSVLTWRKVR